MDHEKAEKMTENHVLYQGENYTVPPLLQVMIR